MESRQSQRLNKSMSSSSKKPVKTVPVKKARTPPTQPKLRVLAPFQGVTEVDTAPVALGNTLRSVPPKVSVSGGIVNVIGRDFVMPIAGISSNFSTWALSGGMPLTPAALVTSVLKSYFAAYQQYKFKKVNVHFITSSPTSLSGDLVLLHHLNRGGPKVNHNSPNFLAYALSSRSAVLGAQWNNHSMVIPTATDWLSTDILNAEDLQHQSYGEILVYTRGTTNGSVADSPGYLVIDYEIDFRSMMVNPRVNTLPSSLFKWFNLGLSTGSISPLQGSRVIYTGFSAINYPFTSSSSPSGSATGLIYQTIIDLDVSSNPNGLNMATCWSAKTDDGGGFNAFAVSTGTTFYAVASDFPVVILYPSYDAALSGRPLVWSANFTSIILSTCFLFSLCGSTVNTFTQANIG